MKDKKDLSVTIIIPVCNEEMNIGTVLDGINAIKDNGWDIIVVNDGSDDATASIAREKGAFVISHPYRIGNGAAIKSGIRIARGDIIVMMDGDGQHRPEDIPGLLIEMNRYEMAVGARNWESHSSLHRGLSNKIYNLMAGYIVNRKVPDLTSGFRAVRRDIVKRFLYMLPNSFSYPTTLTLAFIRSGHSVVFFPISAGCRMGSSKIRIFRDGVRFFLIIAKICTIYSPFKIFLPVSMVLFITGVCYYLYWFFTAHKFTNMALMLILLSIIVFLMGLISEQINQLRYDRTEKMKDV